MKEMDKLQFKRLSTTCNTRFVNSKIHISAERRHPDHHWSQIPTAHTCSATTAQSRPFYPTIMFPLTASQREVGLSQKWVSAPWRTHSKSACDGSCINLPWADRTGKCIVTPVGFQYRHLMVALVYQWEPSGKIGFQVTILKAHLYLDCIIVKERKKNWH